jgi:wobble nucleotide-excising tRNase
MLTKLIAIKNVGRFLHSSTPGSPRLAKYTYIVGANGYGKTTICAILRSLKTGDPSPILGRKTLGVIGQSTVDVLWDNANVRFDGGAWSVARPEILIFDGAFVAENIHSGEVVDLEHKRNLYRVIIGDGGVALAERDAELAAASRTKTGEISAAARALLPYLSKGIAVEKFIALAPDDQIDAKIASQQQTIRGLQQADAIKNRASLSEFALPRIPETFEPLLARTIDDVAQDAEQIVSDHIADHGMSDGGGNWIAEGLEHAGNSCPFCGQDIEGLPLIAAFRAVFSSRYMDIGASIQSMKSALGQGFGDGAVARLEATAAQNSGAIDFWKQHCELDNGKLRLPPDAVSVIQQFGSAALSLIDRKASSPLDKLDVDVPFTSAEMTYDEILTAMEQINEDIRAVNIQIAKKKAETSAGDLKTAQAELATLQATKLRYSEVFMPLCNDHITATTEKDTIDRERESVRRRLDAHTNSVVRPYERRINKFLDVFNAGFNIAETTHSYPGGIATSSYQLVINNTPVNLGDAKTPPDQPSFKNTLSAGDRTTLALAFFLASLERDPGLADKTVVFDDPFNSQDAFRRRQTLHEIMAIAGKCAQLVVLSHDATFLKQLWDKAPPPDRICLAIVDHRSQGSKLGVIDIERACLGRTASDMDDLQTYLTTGAGQLIDTTRKMRTVLEAYLRTTFPTSFEAGDWLGDMLRKIRDSGQTHPAYDLYTEIDQINVYTSQYHHGEDVTDTTPDQIDPTELTGFVRRTLKIVNALQA